MNPTVIIATRGRPEVLAATLDSVWRQDVPPREVTVVATERSDVPPSAAQQPGTRILLGGPGSTIQRNIGLDVIPPDADPVVFLDDDVELAPDYLARVVQFLEAHPDVVGLSGVTAHDGPCAREWAIERVRLDSERTGRWWLADSLYGCNMVFRHNAVESVRFDERLALYGWLEDKDFSVRVGRVGPLVTLADARLVHMAARSGRVSGTRLGFAQIMNPVYLWRMNGTLTTRQMLAYVARPLALNAVGIVRPKGIDRLGRLKGNLGALRLIARRQIEPEAVRDIP